MRCPQCSAPDRPTVKETRTLPDGRITRRRRCESCQHSFWTIEQLNETGLRVRKSDGRVAAFVRDSIRTSIVKSAVRDIPELEDLVDAVVAEVYPLAQHGPVPTGAIAEAVLARLRELEPVTHIRFALVHAGRQDRQDDRAGWSGVPEVRDWLLRQYSDLRQQPAPFGLTHVIKRDGRRKPFDRGKLERSIGIASKGRGNREQVRQLATDVAADVERELGVQPMVTSGQIAAEILRSLRVRDHVAYLRYASTVKGFLTPHDYDLEAQALIGAERDNA